MSASTLLLYAKATGHVLAAATVGAPPAQDPKPEALAGAALPVRYIDGAKTPELEVLVPAAQLGILRVDSQVASVSNAREMFVNPDNQVSATSTSEITDVVLKANSLEVKFTPQTTDTVTVWARIQPQKPPQLVSDPEQLAAASRTSSIDFKPPTTPSTPGETTVHLTFETLTINVDYSVLVLVSGFVPFLHAKHKHP